MMAERMSKRWVVCLTLLPRGMAAALLFTALLLGVSIFAMLRLRRAFWPLMAMLFGLSCAFAWSVYALMKA